MTNAYDEIYLHSARTVMARMLDYVTNDMKMDMSLFFKYFIASGLAKEFEKGNCSVVTGKSGVELVKEVFFEIGFNEPSFPNPSFTFHKSIEYWTGWALSYFQWETALHFYEILRYIPLSEIKSYYHPYHEMDIRQFSDKMKELFKERKKDTNLKIIRKENNLTQKELSRKTDIPLRTIQQYEQKQKDINKAQTEYLFKFAKALNCDIEDLIEKIT